MMNIAHRACICVSAFEQNGFLHQTICYCASMNANFTADRRSRTFDRFSWSAIVHCYSRSRRVICIYYYERRHADDELCTVTQIVLLLFIRRLTRMRARAHSWHRRHSQAHTLPKHRYPSIRTQLAAIESGEHFMRTNFALFAFKVR